MVNDGSKDGTADLVQSAYVAKLGADRFRLLRLAPCARAWCARAGGTC